MNDLEKWITLIEQAIQPGLTAGGDEAAALAGALMSAHPSAHASLPRSIDRRRATPAAFLAYVESLVSGNSINRRAPANDAGASVRMFYQLAQASIDRRVSEAMRRELRTHDGQSFSPRGADDQLEAWWFGELAALHAASSYAILTGDPAAWKVVQTAAAFHHAEIQPDHATADPWAIHAFIVNPSCRDLAEMQLNATMLHHAGEPRGLALVLLAEALYCLRHVAKHGQPQPI